jgi:hypothetical protein
MRRDGWKKQLVRKISCAEPGAVMVIISRVHGIKGCGADNHTVNQR